uniref:Myosin Ic, paralog b n=1 Tax=Eptatretus burgeri TaxID=7764 RepID=A0A8C4NDE4_EPTBU
MKLEETVGSHPHFLTHKLGDQKARKTLKREEFRLLHYAGDVNYNVTGEKWSGGKSVPLRCVLFVFHVFHVQIIFAFVNASFLNSYFLVAGFLDKNNDLLFRNLKEVMSVADNPIISSCFPKDELQGQRRPETTATQFKASVAGLMDTLMSKEPSYVRCIKPNDAKQAGRFEDVLVRHQVKYLGLLENVRVRRAGFAYRRDYPRFLDRYKSLCPDTWPNWKGTTSDGIRTLVKHIGYKPDEYKLGRSKIFIRFPKTLFATEDALEARKHSIATKLEASWRGYHHRQKYLTMKQSVVKLQAWWRGIRARRLAARRREAADKIRRLIKGFSNRRLPRCPQNESYLDLLYSTFLLHLREKLPRSPMDKTWPVPPPALKQTSELLREMHMKNLVRCYCKKITPERKAQLESKALASDLFKGKKESYPQSIPKPFLATHLDEKDIKNAKVLQSIGSLADKYGVQVTKFDRRGFKPRPRQLILGADGGWLLGPSEIKQNFLYSQLQGSLPFQHLADLLCTKPGNVSFAFVHRQRNIFLKILKTEHHL